MPRVACAVQDCKYLRQLNLYSNLIDDKALSCLAVIFTKNHVLEVLGLGKNRITEKGLEILAEYIILFNWWQFFFWRWSRNLLYLITNCSKCS